MERSRIGRRWPSDRRQRRLWAAEHIKGSLSSIALSLTAGPFGPLRAMGQPFQMAKGPDGWPEAAA